MLRIDLKRLGKNREAAVEFLRSRLAETPKVKRDQVELDNTRAREVKTIMHKFLHHAKLDGYRVVVINSGLIEIHTVEVKDKPGTREGRGAVPSAWETVPGQSWLKPLGLSRRGKKSKR